MNFLSELKERKIISNITNESKIIEFFKNKNAGLYIGFDPSADSLHLGNYVVLSLLKRFKLNNFKVIGLIGGATGMIGDPSGKKSERNLLNVDVVTNNTKQIEQQIKKIVDIEIFNNLEIYKNMNILTFLRDIGKDFNVNHMLEKEIISKRLDTGISYAEFSYSIIQSYDFYWLYKNKNIHLQIGGSDQWSNITAGVDYIRKNIDDNNLACGMTINLLLKSDGTKFGKSEKGAIYLNANRTSPYEMYQFFLNQSDDNIKNLYYFYSFKKIKEINDLLEEHFKTPALKLAQKLLAEEVVEDIHGKEEMLKSKKISSAIFSNSFSDLSKSELLVAFSFLPSWETKTDKLNIVDLLLESKIVESKRIARELIASNSIYLNNELINSENFLVEKKNSWIDNFSLLRKGKKNYFIIKWN